MMEDQAMQTPKPPAPSQPPLPPDQQALPAHPLPPVDDLPPEPMDAPQGQGQVQYQPGPSLSMQSQAIRQAAIDAFDAIQAKMPAPAAVPAAGAPRDPLAFGEDYLRNTFNKDVADRIANTGLGTGFTALDLKQPFDPGYYVLGAIPSLGKTSLCIQWADQIAAMGRPVLYFALEQTRLDYYSRSLARFFFRTHLEEALEKSRAKGLPPSYAYWYHDKLSKYPVPSATDIQRGYVAKAHPKELADQIDRYINDIGNRVCVIQGDFGVTVEDIDYIVHTYIDRFGTKPVVFVDYLQIMAPTKENGRTPDTKTATDHICEGLKRLYLECGTTVVAISSLNRQNYLAPISFESFRESGGIEFTADVMAGAELEVMYLKGFYNLIDKNGHEGRETSLTFKRNLIKAAKKMEPRQIRLSILKNRFGVSNLEFRFLYFPANDYFQSVTDRANEVFHMSINEEGGFKSPPELPGSGGNATFENPGDGDGDGPEGSGGPAKGVDPATPDDGYEHGQSDYPLAPHEEPETTGEKQSKADALRAL